MQIERILNNQSPASLDSILSTLLISEAYTKDKANSTVASSQGRYCNMRCAIYTRVSTKKEEKQNSLVTQKEAIMNLITAKEWELYDIYMDVDPCTKTKKRHELKRLINDAKEKKFDIILSADVTRLARDKELSSQIKSLADDQGIHILTLDGVIDTLSGNTKMFGLYAWLYENESRGRSERIKSGLKARAQRKV
ncbi:MAG: recombinase family protein [Anaerobacillus sp.]|uniref:recombinase family protein n=1 Tax=Anaerobacillus sp. TaxID=1872506 RepID=UPI00391B8EDB